MSRTNTIKMLMTAVMIFALAGCATIKGFPNPVSYSTQPDLTPGAKGYYSSEKAKLDYEKIDTSDPAAAQYAANREKKKLLRNAIVDARMSLIDDKFREFEVNLSKEGVGFGIGTDWVGLALTGATASIGGAATKAALGAAATGVKGAQTSYTTRAFYEKTLPVLIGQMVGTRNLIRAKVATKKTLPDIECSLDDALIDVNDYFEAGSIPGALKQVADHASDQSAKADTATLTQNWGADGKPKAPSAPETALVSPNTDQSDRTRAAAKILFSR